MFSMCSAFTKMHVQPQYTILSATQKAYRIEYLDAPPKRSPTPYTFSNFRIYQAAPGGEERVCATRWRALHQEFLAERAHLDARAEAEIARLAELERNLESSHSASALQARELYERACDELQTFLTSEHFKGVREITSELDRFLKAQTQQ